MLTRRWMTAVAACVLLVSQARATDSELARSFSELLPGIGGERDFEQPQQKWQELCWKAAAPGHEADRLAACQLMADKLGPATPARARVWLLKQLERIGHGECVEAVAAAVSDSDRLVRDGAVRALANNPDRAAGAKIAELLRAAHDHSLKVALINALGFRANPASTPVLGSQLHDTNPEVAAAAAHALGRVGTTSAISSLEPVLKTSTGAVRLEVGNALAKCAAKLLAQGKPAEAKDLAKLLYQPGEPARLAGLELLLQTAGNGVARTILEAIEHGEKADAPVVLRYVAKVNSHGIKQLADGLSSLAPTAQVALLRALGPRRDRAALPAVVAATKSDDAAVRLAALGALGGLGDASTVPVLDEAMKKGGPEASVARESLESVFGTGVDEAVVALMKATPEAGRRGQFIEILERRRAAVAVPALLAEATGDDSGLRRRALSALANVAGPGDVTAMIRGMLRTRDSGERSDAERAIAQVCARIADPDQQAAPALAVYETASPADQVALITLLGRVGGPSALKVVREAVASSEPARHARGIDALCDWPDAAVADDLAALAESTPAGETKQRVVRSLAHIAVLPSGLSEEAKLALLVRALKQADRTEEKRIVIDRARDIQSFAAVRFVAPFLDDPKTAGLAAATIVEILHHEELRQPRDECDRILDKVIKTSRDKSLVERAKSFKSKP